MSFQAVSCLSGFLAKLKRCTWSKHIHPALESAVEVFVFNKRWRVRCLLQCMTATTFFKAPWKRCAARMTFSRLVMCVLLIVAYAVVHCNYLCGFAGLLGIIEYQLWLEEVCQDGKLSSCFATSCVAVISALIVQCWKQMNISRFLRKFIRLEVCHNREDI